jgi:hypothetical protein
MIADARAMPPALPSAARADRRRWWLDSLRR